jgi:hypothetical protein
MLRSAVAENQRDAKNDKESGDDVNGYRHFKDEG